MSAVKRNLPDCDSSPHKRMATNTMQHLKCPRDIVGECPYEILCNVLYELDFDTICICLNVSRTWRHRISSIADFWKEIENIPWGFWPRERASIILPFVSGHVEKICLSSYPTEVALCAEALRRYRFFKLQCLTLIAQDSPFDTTTLTVPIYYAVTRLQSTLRDLHLVTGWHSPLSIRVILTICPNLTVLKVNTGRITGDDKELRIPHKSLINLEITLPSNQNLKVQRILRSVPNIRYLMIRHRSIVDLLPTILQYCPRLSMISNQSLAFERIKDTLLQSSLRGNGDQGLQCIAIEQLCLPQCLLPLLGECQHTLKHIYLRGGNYVGVEIGWHHLSTFAMPQLTELHLVGYTKSLIEQIATVIRGSPNLQVIGLKNNCVYWNQQELRMAEDILTALLGLNHMSSLSLTRFDVRSQVFMQLLESCVASDCLTVLSMISCTSFCPAALHLAVRMQSLKVLDLTSSMNSINESDVNEFARMIEHLPQLYHLSLVNWKISNEAAYSIIRSESLQMLYIDGAQMTHSARTMLDTVTTTTAPTSITDLDTDGDFRWMNYR